MNREVKEWFEEVKPHTQIHQAYDCNFLIYKGFKITESKNGLELLDVRLSNTYTKVSDCSLKKIRQYGFIKGVDTIGYERDVKRVTAYSKKLIMLGNKLSLYEENYEKNKKLNEKRIRNTKIKMEDCMDLIIFYQARIKQFKFKYNKNE